MHIFIDQFHLFLSSKELMMNIFVYSRGFM